MSILHAYSYRVGNCTCLLQHTARWFSIANNLLEFFVHDVSSPDSGVPMCTRRTNTLGDATFHRDARKYLSGACMACDLLRRASARTDVAESFTPCDIECSGEGVG